MRRLTLFLTFLAGLVAGPALAAPDIKFRVVHHLDGSEANRVSRALETALNRFVGQVRGRLAHPDATPTVSFEFSPDGALRETSLPQRLPPNAIALVVGSVVPADRGWVVSEASVYLGPSAGRSVLRLRENLFNRAWASISLQFASQNEVENFELLIGYALLQWAWLSRQDDLAQATARTLLDRTKAIIGHQGGAMASSQCVRWVQAAAAIFVPRAPARPDPRATDPGLSRYRCRN